METFSVTRISVTNTFSILSKKITNSCESSNWEIHAQIITDFVHSEGYLIAETPSAIKELSDRNWAVLVRTGEDYDIWNMLIVMELALPLVADGTIAYPDQEALTNDPDCPVPGICTTC